MVLWRWVVFAISMSWFVPIMAFAQERPYDWGRGMHPMMWGAWGFGMMLMMILFWGLGIVGIVMIIRWLVRRPRTAQ
jgi:hypothetical protein